MNAGIFILEILYSNENEWATTTYSNVDKYNTHTVRQKKPDEKNICHTFLFVKNRKNV